MISVKSKHIFKYLKLDQDPSKLKNHKLINILGFPSPPKSENCASFPHSQKAEFIFLKQIIQNTEQA